MLAKDLVLLAIAQARVAVGPASEERDGAGAADGPLGQLESTDQVLGVGYAQLRDGLRAEVSDQRRLTVLARPAVDRLERHQWPGASVLLEVAHGGDRPRDVGADAPQVHLSVHERDVIAIVIATRRREEV